jgi:hypothetical protein
MLHWSNWTISHRFSTRRSFDCWIRPGRLLGNLWRLPHLDHECCEGGSKYACNLLGSQFWRKDMIWIIVDRDEKNEFFAKRTRQGRKGVTVVRGGWLRESGSSEPIEFWGIWIKECFDNLLVSRTSMYSHWIDRQFDQIGLDNGNHNGCEFSRISRWVSIKDIQNNRTETEVNQNNNIRWSRSIDNERCSLFDHHYSLKRIKRFRSDCPMDP